MIGLGARRQLYPSVFSTSNFNLVDAQVFGALRQHTTVFVCSISLRLLVSICRLGLIHSTTKVWMKAQPNNRTGLDLRHLTLRVPCMSANMNVTLCADTFDPFCMRPRSPGVASKSVLLVSPPRCHLSTDESLDPDNASCTTSWPILVYWPD